MPVIATCNSPGHFVLLFFQNFTADLRTKLCLVMKPLCIYQGMLTDVTLEFWERPSAWSDWSYLFCPNKECLGLCFLL